MAQALTLFLHCSYSALPIFITPQCIGPDQFGMGSLDQGCTGIQLLTTRSFKDGKWRYIYEDANKGIKLSYIKFWTILWMVIIPCLTSASPKRGPVTGARMRNWLIVSVRLLKGQTS